jgi:outer membrane protein
MKKIVFILAIACTALLAGSKVNAQTKLGYFSVEQMVNIMPETAKLDTLLEKFKTDSIGSTLNLMIQDYNYKDSMLNKNPDSLKIPAVTRAQYRRDLESLAFQIQNWQQIAQQMVQEKQDQLFGPLYKRVGDALRTVAKEKGYGYVVDKSVFLVAPDGDDLLPMVAAKLGVKMPAGMAQPKTTPKQ